MGSTSKVTSTIWATSFSSFLSAITYSESLSHTLLLRLSSFDPVLFPGIFTLHYFSIFLLHLSVALWFWQTSHIFWNGCVTSAVNRTMIFSVIIMFGSSNKFKLLIRALPPATTITTN